MSRDKTCENCRNFICKDMYPTMQKEYIELCLNSNRKMFVPSPEEVKERPKSRFDRFLKGLPSVHYIKLKQPEIKFDSATNLGEITTALMAKVIDYENKVLFDAMVKYATEQDFTDLYLIDEEFLKAAIIHEIERRKRDEQREITD